MTTVGNRPPWLTVTTSAPLVPIMGVPMNDNDNQTSREATGFFVATWRTLEEGLLALAVTPERAELVGETIWSLRKAQNEGVSGPALTLRTLAAIAFLTDAAPLAQDMAMGTGVTGSTPSSGWA
jgi:hypothetical protein